MIRNSKGSPFPEEMVAMRVLYDDSKYAAYSYVHDISSGQREILFYTQQNLHCIPGAVWMLN